MGAAALGGVSPSESDFYSVSSGESLTFFVSVHIEKGRDGLFNLIVNGTGYGYWLLTDLKRGIYHVRLTYRALTNLYDMELFGDFWRGAVHTPFVEFCSIKP